MLFLKGIQTQLLLIEKIYFLIYSRRRMFLCDWLKDGFINGLKSSNTNGHDNLLQEREVKNINLPSNFYAAFLVPTMIEQKVY